MGDPVARNLVFLAPAPFGATGAGRLSGRTALVTAAAQGIGAGIARRLAAEGAIVIATDINDAKLAELDVARSITRVADATDSEAMGRIVEEAGDIDVLVNCAGWVHQGTILDCSPGDWSRALAINVTSQYVSIRAVLPRMLEAGRGSIVNIASIASSVKAVPNRAGYAAAKAAVIGLTKSVAIDFVARGVRCNAICPGTIQSPSLDERINAFVDPLAARAAFVARQPMGRLGTPEEVASLAAYLASDESAFMTGAILVLDGGMAA